MFPEPLDFAAMYRAHKAATDFKSKSAEAWNAKAADMATSVVNSPYVDAFLSRMTITADDTVLDVGCGPGTLAVPLAKRVRQVIAVDYSSQMLKELRAYAEREGVDNITTHHLGWDEAWHHLPPVDIAVASRSMEVADVEAALNKLSGIARKACYVTSKVGGSFVDREILDYIGRTVIPKPDYWYIPLILYQKGYLPRIDYIETRRSNLTFDDADAFVASLRWSLGTLDETETAKARRYYDEVIVKAQHPPRPLHWAFIAWSPRDV